MSVGLLGDVQGSDDADEDFFEVVLAIALTELREGAFGKKLAGLNDTDDVAQLFHLAHDVRRENDSFATLAALADEIDDRAGGHNVESQRGFIEDHHLRV